MQILSIGNSFSQDAQRYLSQVASADGASLICTNLYIGGCSLEKHYDNYIGEKADYLKEVNGKSTCEYVSINQALREKKYDAVTLQQVSGLSGDFSTYEPYLDFLAAEVRKNQNGVKIYFHKTWNYEQGSSHPDFSRYDCSAEKMSKAIEKAAEKAAEMINADGIIKTGNVISALSKTDCFKNGNALYRDGFHLSLNYGRFAAALCFYRTLTGKSAIDNNFSDTEIPMKAEMFKAVKEIVEKTI